MKSRIFTLLICIAVGLAFYFPVKSQTDGFVIVGAYQTANYAISGSSPLNIYVAPRFIFQYLRKLRYYTLSAAPPELIHLIQQVDDRFIFQYVAWNKYYSFVYPVGLIGDNLLPIISNLADSYQEPNIYIISWDTDEYTDATIEYGTSPGNYTQYQSDTLYKYQHGFQIIESNQCLPYYYQVCSTDRSGNTACESSSFTTYCPSPDPFNKISPTDGAVDQSITPTLTWQSTSPVTYYQYCYDTSINDPCSNWTSIGTATNVTLPTLSYSTTYKWHVRAYNSTAGPTYSNGSASAFWTFTTIDEVQTNYKVFLPAIMKN